MISLSVHRRPRPYFPLPEILRQRGMSQYELAKRTRLSTTYLNRIYLQKVTPTWRIISVIAAALDLQLGDLTPPTQQAG